MGPLTAHIQLTVQQTLIPLNLHTQFSVECSCQYGWALELEVVNYTNNPLIACSAWIKWTHQHCSDLQRRERNGRASPIMYVHVLSEQPMVRLMRSVAQNTQTATESGDSLCVLAQQQSTELYAISRKELSVFANKSLHRVSVWPTTRRVCGNYMINEIFIIRVACERPDLNQLFRLQHPVGVRSN